MKALGRLPEALAAYEDVGQQHPNDVVAKNGRATALALAERWNDALAVIGDPEPATRQEWIGLHIRGMIHLRKGEVDLAAEILERGVRECPWPSSRDYFRTALAVARLRQEDPVAAVEALEEVSSEELRSPANLILVHAHGLREGFKQAARTFRQVKDDIPVLFRDLRDELNRRFVARSGGRFDDTWLFDQEASLLLSVA